MSNAKQFRTIAGRWKMHAEVSKLDRLTERDQTLAMLMFFAGFSAALDATMEVADFPEGDAMQLLSHLHGEVEQIEAMATRFMSGVVPS